MKTKDINELIKTVQYIDAKMAIYIEALRQISEASDQHNPVDLRNKARTALDQEPTTADEFNEQQEMLDNHRDTQAEIAEYDKKLSEKAESTWRDTVLHQDYKSEYDEEE